MYPTGTPITTMSVINPGQGGPGGHPSCLYEPSGSVMYPGRVTSVTNTAQYPQGPVTNTAQYPQGPVTNTAQYPQGPVTNTAQYPQGPMTNTAQYSQGPVTTYQQSSLDQYHTRMHQQAAAHRPFTMQTSVPSNPPDYQKPQSQASYSQNVPGRIPQQQYPGSTHQYFSATQPSVSVPSFPAHSAGVPATHRPRVASTLPAGFTPQVFRAPSANRNDLTMFEQPVQTVQNPNFSRGDMAGAINLQYPSLRQSLNPSPPLSAGPQSGWAMDGTTSRRSPQTGTTVPAPPSCDYIPQNRQVPATVPYTHNLPLQKTISVKRYPPRLCHIIKGPGYGHAYGFIFAVYQDGAYVRQIEKGSTAETAGLYEDDKIIEVNGFNVEGENQEQILEKMRGLPNEMKVFVMDKATYAHYKKSGVHISSSMASTVLMKSLPVQSGPSVTYPRADQPRQASPPVLPGHQGTIDPATVSNVPLQRTYTGFGGADNEISVPEPDDRKIMGNWYAKPESNETKPATATSERNTEVNVTNSPDNVLGLQRADSPNSMMQAKIFEMIQRGTPYSHFNDPSHKNSPSNSEAASTSVAVSTTVEANTSSCVGVSSASISYVGSYRFNVNMSETEGTNTSVSQSEIDTKEGITLIHMDKDGGGPGRDINVNAQVRGVEAETREPVKETVTGISPFFIGAMNLANQLDLDKDAALSDLNSHIGSIIDKTAADSVKINRSEQNKVPSQAAGGSQEKEKKLPHTNARVSETTNSSDSIPRSSISMETVGTSNSVISTGITAEPNLTSNSVLSTGITAQTVVTSTSVQSNRNISKPVVTGTCVPNNSFTSKPVVNQLPSKSKVSERTKAVEKPKSKKVASPRKLKVKFGPPAKKVTGSDSPSKHKAFTAKKVIQSDSPCSPTKLVAFTWKKKAAAKALKEHELHSDEENIPGPQIDGEKVPEKTEISPTKATSKETDSGKIDSDKATKKKKKRTSSEAFLHEDCEQSPTSKRGRGRGRGVGCRGTGRGHSTRGRGYSRAGNSGGGRGRQTGRGKGRSKSRGRGLRVVAPAQNMSWQELLALRRSLGDESPQPTIEVDVDEVGNPSFDEVDATSVTEQNSPERLNTTSSTIDEAPAATSYETQASTDHDHAKSIRERESDKIVNTAEVSKVKIEAVETELAAVKTEPHEGDTEKPIPTEIVDNFDKTELHTNGNLVLKTDRHTLSWVLFHGCKVLLINSEDGDYMVMKELVFEVFRPRKPEKSTQASRYTLFKDLSKQLKIQHIYKTKEKKLKIMYKPMDPDVFEIVHQILLEKRVIHKVQERLGVISLSDALLLYHFITKVGKSECADINVRCVIPYESQAYEQRKDEMDLIYPVRFDTVSFKSFKAVSKESHSEEDVGSVVLKQKPRKSNVPKPEAVVIEISSDEDSCHSDDTSPYVDGLALELSDLGEKAILKESDSKSLVDKHDTGTEDKERNSANQGDVKVAPQSINTFLLLDSMTKTSESETATGVPVNIELTDLVDVSSVTKDNSSSDTKNKDNIAKHFETVDVSVKASVEIKPVKDVTEDSIDTNSNGVCNEKELESDLIEGTEESTLRRPSTCIEVTDNSLKSNDNAEISEHEKTHNLQDIHREEKAIIKATETEVQEIEIVGSEQETGTDTDIETISKNETEGLVPDTGKENSDSKIENGTAEGEMAMEVPGTSASRNPVKTAKEFFDIFDDDYNFEEDDDLTLIDIDGQGEQLCDEGDRRIDELVKIRNQAKTEEEIDHAWTQALKFQRPIHTLQKAILEAFEKDREHIEEIEELRRENEELKKFVEQHKEFLDQMPECDRSIGNGEPANDSGTDKS